MPCFRSGLSHGIFCSVEFLHWRRRSCIWSILFPKVKISPNFCSSARWTVSTYYVCFGLDLRWQHIGRARATHWCLTHISSFLDWIDWKCTKRLTAERIQLRLKPTFIRLSFFSNLGIFCCNILLSVTFHITADQLRVRTRHISNYKVVPDMFL
jgi:hypothetical protein